MSIVITRELAQRCVDVVDHGLTSGLGVRAPGKFCVEAAISYALGLPHGDNPGCVSRALRRLKIGLNDRAWSSPQARAKGLRRLALAQLGSAGVLDDEEFMRRVVEMTIRKAVPIGLRAAAQVNSTHAASLEAAAVRCEQEGTREAVKNGNCVARPAADAAYAASAAGYAADAAGYAASAAYAADARTCDRVLAAYSEDVVQILIQMEAPGCQFLDLVPLTEAT